MRIKRIISIAVAMAMAVMAVPIAALAAGEDTTFTFSDGGIEASGEGGYSISGTALTIEEPGTYVLTGSCADGSVKVKSGVTGVALVLNNLQLTSATTAPITCNKESAVTIEVVGTSSLADGANNDEGAVIKAKGSSTLTLTGSGTLNATGNAKNGIKGAASAAIIVAGPSLNIEAANNALASDGSVAINSGTLSLVSGNDAIKSEPEEGDTASAGTITINGGSITVASAGDGIQATGLLAINGGTLNFTTGGGYQAALGDDDSAKGIKSGSEVRISGGSFILNCADDGIHSNGNVSIGGGQYTIHSGDDAIHADYILTIGESGGEGPEINIASSVEGIEGAEIYFNSGKGNIVASDDGVNAANSDLTGYAFKMVFNGGNWHINATGGDGVDSNGDIHFNGGTVESFGSSSSNAESALDYDGTCYYNGGTLMAIGYSGQSSTAKNGVSVSFGATGFGGGGGGGNRPGQGTDQDGTRPQPTEGQDAGNRPQPTEGQGAGNRPQPTDGAQPPTGNQGNQQVSSVNISANDTVAVKDANGNELYATTAVKAANSVVFGHASLADGQTYYLYINGEQAGSATAGSTAGQPGNTAGNTGWQQSADGSWRYYGSNGAAATGWVNDGGKWYYMNTSGVMQTGWVKDGGKWYYLNTSGAMQTGWVKDGGKWYYLNTSGAMQTGWAKDGGKWYYLNTSGAMQTGWVNDGGKWYYLNTDGSMATAWKQISYGGATGWYYFYSDGSMATGTISIGGKSYTFTAAGSWNGR